MEKFIYDKNNGLWYELQGDYYIPCLKLPDEEQKEIGVWGMRHLEYIKQHRKAIYNRLQTECKLNSYVQAFNTKFIIANIQHWIADAANHCKHYIACINF